MLRVAINSLSVAGNAAVCNKMLFTMNNPDMVKLRDSIKNNDRGAYMQTLHSINRKINTANDIPDSVMEYVPIGQCEAYIKAAVASPEGFSSTPPTTMSSIRKKNKYGQNVTRIQSSTRPATVTRIQSSTSSSATGASQTSPDGSVTYTSPDGSQYTTMPIGNKPLYSSDIYDESGEQIVALFNNFVEVAHQMQTRVCKDNRVNSEELVKILKHVRDTLCNGSSQPLMTGMQSYVKMLYSESMRPSPDMHNMATVDHQRGYDDRPNEVSNFTASDFSSKMTQKGPSKHGMRHEPMCSACSL